MYEGHSTGEVSKFLEGNVPMNECLRGSCMCEGHGTAEVPKLLEVNVPMKVLERVMYANVRVLNIEEQ